MNSEMVKLIALALVVRYTFMWFNHVWDITTFYNMFINLANGTNPYDEFLRKTYEVRGSVHGWSRWYAYYAYPPGLIYLYTPLAKLWAAMLPQAPTPNYLPNGQLAYPPKGVVSPWFLVLFKTPIFLADIAIGVLLARMADIRAMKLYLFNPLVILVSAMWMFDAIPLLGLVGGVYYVEQDRPALAGISIGIGTTFKFFPIFVAPALALYYLRRRNWSFLIFIVAFGGTVLVTVAPYAHEVLATMEYHGSRVGGGLTLHVLVYAYSVFSSESVLWLQKGLSPAIGSLTLVGGMAIAYIWSYDRDLSLYSTVTVTLAFFMVSSKLVNEQYGMWLVPFLVLILTTDGMTTLRRLVYKASYSIPIGYAVINVPILIFFYPLAYPVSNQLSLLTRLNYPEQLRAIWLSVMAVLFIITMMGVVWTYRVRNGNAIQKTQSVQTPELADTTTEVTDS